MLLFSTVCSAFFFSLRWHRRNNGILKTKKQGTDGYLVGNENETERRRRKRKNKSFNMPQGRLWERMISRADETLTRKSLVRSRAAPRLLLSFPRLPLPPPRPPPLSRLQAWHEYPPPPCPPLLECNPPLPTPPSAQPHPTTPLPLPTPQGASLATEPLRARGSTALPDSLTLDRGPALKHLCAVEADRQLCKDGGGGGGASGRQSRRRGGRFRHYLVLTGVVDSHREAERLGRMYDEPAW